MAQPLDVATGAGFVEVGDRCWVARHDWLDVNVSVVGGDAGLVVVDTHASEVAAREVRRAIDRLGRGPVVAVVNTHEHFDHTFGNAVFRDADAALAIHAHENAAEHLTDAAERAKREYAEDPVDLHGDEVRASRVVVPDHVFSSVRVIDLGDRLVELIHPGRGHTGGDTVVRVPDAGVLFAGDLVEESAARGNVPGFGPDCYPLEWPGALDLVIGMLADETVVVPGHGRPVDSYFVREQRGDIGVVAETVRDLAGRGVPPAEMATAAAWPYPVAELTHAFVRGYEHLPRPGRALPLV